MLRLGPIRSAKNPVFLSIPLYDCTEHRMKTVRMFFLVLAVVGFLLASIIHLLALWSRPPSSKSWDVVLFLGAFVLFVSAAYLGGAKPGRMGIIPFSEIVRGCPTWLRRAEYFFSSYMVLICLWVAIRASGIFHWRKVELPLTLGIVVFSAFSMSFYMSSFSILFGKLFGDNRQNSTSADATHETA